MSLATSPSLYILITFLLFITLFHVTTLHTTATAPSISSGGNMTDHLALLAFKSSITNDPQGVFRSWNKSFHFCEWEGVGCDLRHGRVTILDLGSKGLVGSLSPHVGNMSFLHVLRLENNTFLGAIPPQLGRLFRLQRLYLSSSNFEGEIPANLSHCSNLTHLLVSDNKLVGKFPNELCFFTKLKVLYIHRNNLTGGIPRSIGNLTSLEMLSAAINHIGGSVPDVLGQMKNLTTIGFAGNGLSGTLPPSIFNLSMLTNLSFAVNQLHGSLPPSLGIMLPHLQLFQIWGNQFTGTLPFSISNCSALQTLEMQRNNFSGKIGINFGGLPDLVTVRLHTNNLGSGEPDEMSFISSMTNCSNLKTLVLLLNQLRGFLPNSVGNLSSQLVTLALGGNLLYGKLPSTIGNLVNLTLLGLDINQFVGPIPTEIGNLQNLQVFALDRNNLSGKIPDSIGNISLLIQLFLGNNRLEGNIPPSLGSCKKLLLLDLSRNNLNGTIPKELLRVSALSISLNVGHNHLSGSLPSDVGSLKNLVELDISENELSGELPSGLGSCNSLENLHIEGNFFNGSIPRSLSSLRGIQYFDLSRNNFSGQVPSFLVNFSLMNLNISYNDFEGEVPMEGVFRNTSAISVVGNSKLCGGIPELQLPKCNFKESKKRKMSLALVTVISVVCTVLCVMMVLCFLFCIWLKKKRKGQHSESLSNELFLKVSYQWLLKATDGFSSANLIGVGSYSSVYKGILDEEDETSVVAVKVLNLQRRGASKSFMTECKALRNVRHRNLVKVITSCSSVDFHGNDFKALVYEFMPNGSLERWLNPDPGTENRQNIEIQSLNVLQFRVNIAIDVACALEYLHHHCQTPIVHCDLKPSNVLLDEDMVAHVGDFGVARFLQVLLDPKQSNSVGIKGTIGYVAPEYGMSSEVSIKGDVYSYGILVLEMMTGKRPTDTVFVDGLNLHNFAKTALPDRVTEIVHPMLMKTKEEEETTVPKKIQVPKNSRNDIRKECILSLIRIGVACSMEDPQDRMDITNVLHQLNLVRDNLGGN